MNWFHELSSLQLAVLVIGLTAAFSLAGLALLAPRVRASTLHVHFDNATIVGLLAALIGVYAVAAGLTAVAVWDNLNEAGADVGREATAIAVLYDHLGGYPDEQREAARQALIAYTRQVIEQEWPLHERGELPATTPPMIAAIGQVIRAYEPASDGQQILHARILQSYDRWLDAYSKRLQAVADTALPGELWVVVILLGAIAISSCFLLRIDSFVQHAAVTLLVAAPIALVLYFIAISDHPFQGGISASADAYRSLLVKVMHQPAPE